MCTAISIIFIIVSLTVIGAIFGIIIKHLRAGNQPKSKSKKRKDPDPLDPWYTNDE